MVVSDVPPEAIAISRPKITMKNTMLKVNARRSVVPPKIARLTRMTFRPPNVSKIWPSRGWQSPLTKEPMAATSEMVERFQPNSSLMGMTNTPKALRLPAVTRAMRKVVATMNHP